MTERQCRDQAQHNLKVYEHLKGLYVDWAAVALFYSALHHVDAWLLSQGVRRPGGHNSRAQYLARCGVPDGVQSAYQGLREVSELARYHSWSGLLDLSRLNQLQSDEYQTVVDYVQ